MASLGWIKSKISEQWEKELSDRSDPQRAERGADADGMIDDYENSYSMHHKIVKASAEEVKELMDRYKKAEAGLIFWDEKRQELYEIDG